MLTIFSTPKPFAGHIDVIQRNAILSWQRLHPDIEIILVGDDSGAAEVCGELGIRHIAQVQRNKYGTKYLASIFDRVQEAARHRLLCYVNCDIVLMSDFLRATEIVAQKQERFLMAGRRWDLDVQSRLDFGAPQWESALRKLILESGQQRPPQWIDYFLFPKGLFYTKIPEFVIGRPGWDNWLLWYPLSKRVPVIDASDAVLAVHQNHDYAYHTDGEKGVWEGEEARRNYQLRKGKFRTLASATHLLRGGEMKSNYKRWLVLGKYVSVSTFYAAWFKILDVTRPLRNRLKLHKRRAAGGTQRDLPSKIIGS
jgi:hypothetical protein